VTAPALTPATWAAARLLTGRLLDLVVDPEGGGLLVPRSWPRSGCWAPRRSPPWSWTASR
jgi:hypothetical protein